MSSPKNTRAIFGRGYADEPDRRYPAVYVIQGYTGHLGMWRNRSPYRQPFTESADEVFARGDAPGAIGQPRRGDAMHRAQRAEHIVSARRIMRRHHHEIDLAAGRPGLGRLAGDFPHQHLGVERSDAGLEPLDAARISTHLPEPVEQGEQHRRPHRVALHRVVDLAHEAALLVVREPDAGMFAAPLLRVAGRPAHRVEAGRSYKTTK